MYNLLLSLIVFACFANEKETNHCILQITGAPIEPIHKDIAKFLRESTGSSYFSGQEDTLTSLCMRLRNTFKELSCAPDSYFNKIPPFSKSSNFTSPQVSVATLDKLGFEESLATKPLPCEQVVVQTRQESSGEKYTVRDLLNSTYGKGVVFRFANLNSFTPVVRVKGKVLYNFTNQWEKEDSGFREKVQKFMEDTYLRIPDGTTLSDGDWQEFDRKMNDYVSMFNITHGDIKEEVGSQVKVTSFLGRPRIFQYVLKNFFHDGTGDKTLLTVDVDKTKVLPGGEQVLSVSSFDGALSVDLVSQPLTDIRAAKKTKPVGNYFFMSLYNGKQIEVNTFSMSRLQAQFTSFRNRDGSWNDALLEKYITESYGGIKLYNPSAEEYDRTAASVLPCLKFFLSQLDNNGQICYKKTGVTANTHNKFRTEIAKID